VPPPVREPRPPGLPSFVSISSLSARWESFSLIGTTIGAFFESSEKTADPRWRVQLSVSRSFLEVPIRATNSLPQDRGLRNLAALVLVAGGLAVARCATPPDERGTPLTGYWANWTPVRSVQRADYTAGLTFFFAACLRAAGI